MNRRPVPKKKHSLLSVVAPAALLLVAIVLLILAIRGTADPYEGADSRWDGGWYGDDLGRIGDDGTLVRGMKAYAKRTGVRPYLLLTDAVEPEDLDSFAQDKYDGLFDGDGHLLVVYDEWEEGVYFLSAQAGEGDALGYEDIDALLAAIEQAYADPGNVTYADAFGAGFRQAAEALADERSGAERAVLMALGLLVVVLSAVLTLLLRQRARLLAQQRARYMAEDG